MKARADLRQYLAILVRWALLLILAPVLAGTVAYALSSRQTPIYQTSTTVLIEEAPRTSAGAEYQSILSSERRARTYAELLTATPLLKAVIQNLRSPISVAQLATAVSVRPVRDTQLIRVQVRDADPRRAAQIANMLVTIFAEQRETRQSSRYTASKANLQEQMAILEKQIQQTEASLAGLNERPNGQSVRERLETSLAQYRQSYANMLQSYEQVHIAEAQSTSTVVQEEPAEVPNRPVNPRPLRDAAVAAMVGLLFAVGLVFLKEHLDDTVKDPEELSRQIGLPVLGLIARTRKSEKPGPVVVAEPRSPVAEAYRALRTNIEFASVDRQLRTLLVTSASPNDGKSTTAVNLGTVLAQGGRTVALMDADLRRPTLHKWLELSNRTGLSELFVQPDVHLNGSVRRTSIEEVSVVTAGVVPPNPAELLGSQKMVDILGKVQEQADVVVVDTPPVTAVTDAVVLSQRVDGVLVVVRAGATKLAACKQAVEQLRRADAHLLGVVVNDIPVGRSGYGYGYHSYYTYYHESHQDQHRRTSALPRWLRRVSVMPSRTSIEAFLRRSLEGVRALELRFRAPTLELFGRVRPMLAGLPVVWASHRPSAHPQSARFSASVQEQPRERRARTYDAHPAIAYCMKEKTMRKMKDAQEVTMENGRRAVKGVCEVCGTKMTKFLPSQKAAATE